MKMKIFFMKCGSFFFSIKKKNASKNSVPNSSDKHQNFHLKKKSYWKTFLRPERILYLLTGKVQKINHTESLIFYHAKE